MPLVGGGGGGRSANTFPVVWELTAAAQQHTDDNGRLRVVLYLTRGESQDPPKGARTGGVSYHYHRGRERGHRDVPAAHQRQGAPRRWAEHHARFPKVVLSQVVCADETVFCGFNVADLAHEANPSDHPRASTLFLNKSQSDGKNSGENICCCFVKMIAISSQSVTSVSFSSAREAKKQLS